MAKSSFEDRARKRALQTRQDQIRRKKMDTVVESKKISAELKALNQKMRRK